MSSTATAFSKGTSANTLIASPNLDFRRSMTETLRASSWPVDEAFGGAEALAKMEAGECEVLLLDRWLPDLDVTELVGIVREQYPGVEVYVVDTSAGVPLVSQEPSGDSHRTEILSFLRTACEPVSPSPVLVTPDFRPPVTEPIRLPKPEPIRQVEPVRRPQPVQPTSEVEPLPEMIGTSHAMQQVYRMCRLVSARNTTVLVTGETGTGKELVARAIHLVSPRSKQPFITVNCAAIPEPLLESELFGYTRGAFTGAFQSRVGRIHSAHGGTLFLDEVGELPLSMQAKLLRFLQEGEVQRLGSSDVVRVDARVIAATNSELSRCVAQKTFREDLYYRLSVFPIEVLPLRKRTEDILPLSTYFLRDFCEESDVPTKAISAGAEFLLEQHTWPGNVRELRHVIERAFILSEQSPDILPEHISLQTAWKSQ